MCAASATMAIVSFAYFQLPLSFCTRPLFVDWHGHPATQWQAVI
jgi:hypothetical protein